MSKAYQAICVLTGEGIESGLVRFAQLENGPVKIKGNIIGLSKGFHGFHVHQFGDLSQGCKTAGGHYNPEGKTHGGPGDIERHVGDLGNLKSEGEKETKFEIEDSEISLWGERSIIGRALVLHKGEDDLGRGNDEESKKTGNAGGRIACGVIGLAPDF